jgi:hypothetical protein
LLRLRFVGRRCGFEACGSRVFARARASRPRARRRYAARGSLVASLRHGASAAQRAGSARAAALWLTSNSADDTGAVASDPAVPQTVRSMPA